MTPVRRTTAFATPMMAFALLAAAALGSAQSSSRILDNSYLGVNVGTYLPSDGLVRDIFGSSPVSYGVSLVQPYREARRGLRFDFSTVSLNNDGNNFFLIGGTAGYEVQAARYANRPVGFARVGVGPAFYSYDVNSNGVDASGSRLGIFGTAEVGLTITQNLIVSAKYYGMQKLDGLNFSGLQLSVTVAAFKL